MLKLVELGKVARPHGFKGHFVVDSPSGHESSLGAVSDILIGRSPEDTTPYRIIEASWMPRGWKLHVEGVDTEAQVHALKGATVYAPREELPETEDGEYYISDLIGASVIDTETAREVGTLSGVETDGQHRWWIRSSEGEFAIPANAHFIVSVDVEQRQIRVRNLSELP
jgi:16S rRNA processing protein RimM